MAIVISDKIDFKEKILQETEKDCLIKTKGLTHQKNVVYTTYTHICVYIHTHNICISIYMCMYIHKHMRIHTCVYINIHIYNIYTNIYTHIYTHRQESQNTTNKMTELKGK